MTFLEDFASDLLSRFGTDLSRVAVVFPNKRASLFLNEHLARQAGRPLWSPAYITISDLFRSHSRLKVADPILLVCKLHQCFTQCTGIDETLDHFYGWGQLLLSDFDDLDKNMGPADRVFANLRDIHELDDVSYLTAEQRQLIQRFFSNFSEEHNSELKKRFLRLWSHMGDIYHAFNRQLAQEGLAYEGALYRQVAEDESVFFEYETYIFAGFNLLQQVEQTLFRRLEREGKALFYQDTKEQPPQQLTFISASTENIQARYVSQWLTPERIADGRRTAVVLCNEGLLQAVIHSLPDAVDKVNVTTGYPLIQTPVASLVTQLLNLQVNGFSARTKTFRRCWKDIVSRHPYAALLPEEYADTHHADTSSLLHWLMDIVRHVATSPSEFLILNSQLHTESVFRMYTLLNRLTNLTDKGILTVESAAVLQRLITQIVQSTTIPFHGEPAEGVQVMGVLETRNLDFDHVLLLSCNEGYMPRGENDTSFIPYAIRKAYGLTTIDQKVAIYQHYFHRLLQRAHDVTILYNNGTSGSQRGEMSRFMLQLMVERPLISKISLRGDTSQPSPTVRGDKTINKTPEVLYILRQRLSKQHGGISPTAVSNYLRCQLRFFYLYVSNLQEPEETDDELTSNRAFGNIFHKAAHILYHQFINRCVNTDMFDHLLNDEIAINRAVDSAIHSELSNSPSSLFTSPSPLHLDGLQLINREVIIRYVRLLIETDRRLAPFTILGLEKHVDFTLPCRHSGFSPSSLYISGYIDRLDLISDSVSGEDRIRVVDYKTGARHLRPLPDIDAIFDPAQIPNHSDYYLQAFLYSYIVSQKRPESVSPTVLFIQHAGNMNYNPTLMIGREHVNDVTVHADRFIQLFSQTVADIFNPTIPFRPTDDRNRCRFCPYASLCGR